MYFKITIVQISKIAQFFKMCITYSHIHSISVVYKLRFATYSYSFSANIEQRKEIYGESSIYILQNTVEYLGGNT